MRVYSIPAILSLTLACGQDTPTVARPIAATSTSLAVAKPFPDVIPLPTGFSPEGIAFGRGSTFYVGSIFTSAVFRGDARTGAGSLIVSPQAGREHAGLDYHRQNDWLIVAGGTTGQAYIYDATTGAALATYQLGNPSEGPTLVNDVMLTRDGAYFTDSYRPVIYRLRFAPGEALATGGTIEVIPLTGAYQHEPGSLVAGNANGIAVTPDERHVIVVNTTTGKLYLVDNRTGVAGEIDLGGGSLVGGDGILLVGNTLYVVQGGFNRIAVVRLSDGFTRGVIDRVISDPAFRFPSTVAAFGSSLYVVNARFDATGYPDVEFEVVRVGR